MAKNESLFPLGKYIRLSKEKNTQLLATRHFGLSASEGLKEQSIKESVSKFDDYLLRKGEFVCDLINFGKSQSFSFALYCGTDLASVSSGNATVFSTTNNSLNNEYLSLIFKSQRTKNILLHYACRGCHKVLSWKDFCNLPIRVPPPASKKN